MKNNTYLHIRYYSHVITLEITVLGYAVENQRL